MIRAIILILGAALLGLYSSLASATLIKTSVGQYNLQCDEVFSCPQSLHGRVAFWVEVFARWDTSTAVFHDTDKPERVYSTVEREQGCRHSKKGDAIYKQRRYLKKLILSTAAHLEKKRGLSRSQAKIAKLFEGESSREMRAAAERVRCQSGNKDRFRTALEQFHIYRPTILSALSEQQLSSEIAYLPFVESAFNPRALSHVGAAGLWQIMPSTARALGLIITNSVDERYDPERASYAAARYFRKSVDNLTVAAHEKGASVTQARLNPFVITSYNYGVKGMSNAIAQVGLDYERLLQEYKSPSFQTAVRNFYASFLAARHVAKNSDRFFGEVVRAGDTRPSHSTVVLERPTSIKRISKVFDVDQAQLKSLNPAIKKRAWAGKVLLAKNYRLKLPQQGNSWTIQLANLSTLPREYEQPGHLWHRVKKGQTACGVASRYNTSCRGLRRLNKLNSRGTIYVGQRLKVPTRGGGISTDKPSHKQNTVASTSTGKIYQIKRGDTACRVARRHSMSCSAFLAANNLNRKSLLKIGQKVNVAGSSSSSSPWHVVRKGQTACGIAQRYSVACGQLLSVNSLSRRSTIRIGQRLRIPVKG